MPEILTLEEKTQPDKTVDAGSGKLATPPIDGSYWRYRVKLSDRQAIVGFPKFGTIGIAFQSEEDCNTNLPFTCAADRIYRHIRVNQGDDSIEEETVLRAICMVQEAAARDVANG